MYSWEEFFGKAEKASEYPETFDARFLPRISASRKKRPK
jgi:hypothetical protein